MLFNTEENVFSQNDKPYSQSKIASMFHSLHLCPGKFKSPNFHLSSETVNSNITLHNSITPVEGIFHA